MASSHGRFTWYELTTTDTQAAKTFYGKVLGLGTRDVSKPGMAYTLFTLGEAPVGGLMELPEDLRKKGVPPHWIGYVGVDDVDATAEEIKRLGGAEHHPPTDIPDIGRFAAVADPQTAAFALLKWLDPERGPPATPGTPGRIGWHELLAADWEKAFAFYSALFGWQKAEAVTIGAMGTYQLFSVGGGEAIGGMFNKPEMVPVPFWLYYFNVSAIEPAAERVKAGGGQIANGPMEVPGGHWIVQCMDPQGAMFAMVGKQK